MIDNQNRLPWQRMQDYFGEVTPEAIGNASEEELQALGMTFRKAEYIRDFSRKIIQGEFDLEAVADMPDDAVKALACLKGLGIWTAEMILLFCLQRPDILSSGDLAIHRGMRMVYHHRKIDRKLFEKYRRRLSSYCSVASLYFRAVAGGAYAYPVIQKEMSYMRNEIIDKRNSLIAEKVIRYLQARHMEGYYAATKEQALETAMKLIPEHSVVSWGGSVSISEIGLKQAIKEGPYTAIDRDSAATPEERKQLMKQSLTADAFLMGTNAITEDGQLVNLDGLGNRVAALCYGPDSVIVIAGMNKLVPTLEDAISRTRKYAAPVNAQRFSETACQKDGTCHDCLMKDCICGKLVITRCDMDYGRVKVILVGEDLGY